MLKLKQRLNINRIRPNYCSRCGTKLSSKAKYCPNCGKPVNSPEKIKSLRRPILSSLGAIFIALILIGVSNANLLPAAALAFEIFIGAMLIWQCIRLVRRTIPVINSGSLFKKVVSYICLGLATLAVGYSIGGVYYGHRQRMDKYQNLVSDYLANAAAAKYAGDLSVQSGQPELAKVNAYEKTVVKGLKNLQPPKSMVKYRDNVTAWTQSLADATTAQDWAKIGPMPANFTLKLTSPTKRHIYNQLLAQLDNIKAYGDSAIANKNPEAMAFTYGRLTTQQYLLGILGKKYCEPTPKKSSAKTICSDQLGTQIKAIQAGINTIISSDGANGTDWNNSSSNLATTLQKAGQNVEKTVTGTADADKGQTVPQAVDQFWAGCKKLNGSALHATVKQGIPDIEGGSTCYFNKGNSNCWDMLTDSGREYAGGQMNCPSKGLVPSLPAASNYHYDGTYDIHSTGDYCSTANPRDLTATASSIVVTNNEITDIGSLGQAFLNDSGDAQIAENTQDGNQLTINAHFDQLDTVQGAWSLKGTNDNCSGSFSGTLSKK